MKKGKVGQRCSAPLIAPGAPHCAECAVGHPVDGSRIVDAAPKGDCGRPLRRSRYRAHTISRGALILMLQCGAASIANAAVTTNYRAILPAGNRFERNSKRHPNVSVRCIILRVPAAPGRHRLAQLPRLVV